MTKAICTFPWHSLTVITKMNKTKQLNKQTNKQKRQQINCVHNLWTLQIVPWKSEDYLNMCIKAWFVCKCLIIKSAASTTLSEKGDMTKHTTCSLPHSTDVSGYVWNTPSVNCKLHHNTILSILTRKVSLSNKSTLEVHNWSHACYWQTSFLQYVHHCAFWGSGPEWHISSMLCSPDIPFWSTTLHLHKDKELKSTFFSSSHTFCSITMKTYSWFS